jgi:hypothetical protein
VKPRVGRSRIEKRLQTLEGQLTDQSRLVPHTKAWLLYWTERLGKYLTREVERMEPLIPLEAWRAVQKACEAGQVDSPYARIIRGEDESEYGAPAQTPAKA